MIRPGSGDRRRRTIFAAAAAVAVAVIAGVLLLRGGGSGPDVDPALLDPASGGETTAFDLTDNAFGLSARNITREERRTFEIGDSLFTQNWVTAPSSTDLRDGLGPLMNAQACASCHVKDGRARPPRGADDPERGLLLRLSVPGTGGAPRPHPVYGDQLQDRAILGVPAEGRIGITYQPRPGTFADGQPYELRHPAYRIEDPAYGPVGARLLISPRIAQQVVGMGLLEAIPEADVLAAADPGDADGDGISGRPNRVRDLATGDEALGRMGWKANVATVADQAALAFRGDIGITSGAAPEQPCTPSERACAAAPNGGRPEIDDDTFAKVALYVRTLAVPGRRDLDDPDVEAGAAAFVEAGCVSCHTPTQRTGDSPLAAVAGQTIHPYTDLLLHDMGPGLADGRPDGRASGREWRTAPLWGIGLVEDINDHTEFLHDGRARSLTEAILWHDGEGAAAKEWFRTADREDREALITFLESL